MHENYTYQVVHLETDPGTGGFRTFDFEVAHQRAVEQASETHRRQVIESFPYAEQPSRTVYRVREVDVEDVIPGAAMTAGAVDPDAVFDFISQV